MPKLKHNKLPNKFQELFKLNHTVHTIQTRNKDDFHHKYYSKTFDWVQWSQGVECTSQRNKNNQIHI